VPRLRTGRPGFDSRQRQEFFSPPLRPDRLWIPPNLLSKGKGGALSSWVTRSGREADHSRLRGCIQKFPDWTRGARTANDIALCHCVQLYRYFVSHSSEYCYHNTWCCFSTSVYCCLFRYRLSPETFGYTLVCRAAAKTACD
jgi:hypothetical protein